MKNGNKVFSKYGIYNRKYYNWQTSDENVQRWRAGLTGMPLVDALMREMNKTGFMPNRGRMVVACYFAMDIKQDWRFGAHWFEERLIDHDVQSNYGGWAGSAGIGAGRVLVFNSLTQSMKFDPNGEYIKKWVPELSDVPAAFIHDPWNIHKSMHSKFGVQIGKEHSDKTLKFYPAPIPCEKYTSTAAAEKTAKALKSKLPKEEGKAKER